MIDITNIEYNVSQLFTSLSLLSGYTFCVDSFKSNAPATAYCLEGVTVGEAGDQGRSLNTVNMNIKVRDEADYLAKEAAYTIYQKKEVFGFNVELPVYTDGSFSVPAKTASTIKAVNAPSFLQTDSDGRAVYLMSVEIKISSS